MTTFREIYERRGLAYVLGIQQTNGKVTYIDFGKYCLWSKISIEALDSNAYTNTVNYGESLKNRYEVYSTIDGVVDRLEDILREQLEERTENVFHCPLHCIRKALKTIYKTKQQHIC